MLVVFDLRREGMHIDVSIRTIFRAKATTDAPILDDHLERIAPPDRADRATHHAEGVAALAARRARARVVARIPVVLPTMHICWGVGFLTSPRSLIPGRVPGGGPRRPAPGS